MSRISREQNKILKEAGLEGGTEGEMTFANRYWRRADNVRRGLLVTQLSTAMRNLETQVGRVGVDILETGFNRALRSIFPESQPTTHPVDAFGKAIKLMIPKRNKKLVDDILKQFPEEQDRLFLNYSSDIVSKQNKKGTAFVNKKDAVLTKAEGAVQLLNVVNRFQEFVIRRAVFRSKLEQVLHNRGKNLKDIVKDNKIKDIRIEDIKQAVDSSLEVTFAETPKGGTFGAAWVSVVNKSPLSLIFPFPRFMVNSLKFNFQFSPFGFLKLLKRSERDSIANGNFKTISRAMIGTTLLGIAYQVRESDNAGERWYEWKTEEGKTVDLRPFNPFAAYLFLADWYIKARDDMLHTFTSKDIAMGVLSTNLRAGLGLYALDKALQIFTQGGNKTKALRAVKEFPGELVGGLLTPLGTIYDFMSEFNEGMRTVKEKREEPFLGPIKARLPIPSVHEKLKPYYLPTRSKPLRRETPMLRQLTGLSIREKRNPVENELVRLGFSSQEILPKTGYAIADQLMAKNMGGLIEKHIIPIVSSNYYNNLTDAEKGYYLREMLIKIRKAARLGAIREDPELFRKIKFERITKRKKKLLEERGFSAP